MKEPKDPRPYEIDKDLDPKEAARRRDAIVKRMIATPPSPRATATGKRKKRKAKT